MRLLTSISVFVVYLVAFVAANLTNNSAADGDPVSKTCAKCLCQAMTGCQTNDNDCKDGCGLYQMTRPYWIDAHRPTVNGEDPDSGKAFENCAKNYQCCVKAANSYMRRYGKDCNSDGVTDCQDYAAIHKNGPGACSDSTGIAFGKQVAKCVNTKAQSADGQRW